MEYHGKPTQQIWCFKIRHREGVGGDQRFSAQRCASGGGLEGRRDVDVSWIVVDLFAFFWIKNMVCVLPWNMVVVACKMMDLAWNMVVL